MPKPSSSKAKLAVRPIRSEPDYESALEQIDTLLDCPPDSEDADLLDVLTTLVDAYEDQHYPMPSPDPVEALKYYMESRGLSRRDLEPFIGTRARVTEIMNRRRPLTIDMIRRLHAGTGIPAEVLIQSYPVSPGPRARRPVPALLVHAGGGVG